MSSPISSALAKLDGSLHAVQSQVDSLRAGLEVNDSELSYSLADARQNAVIVRDLIRAERSDASWGDRGSLEFLIHELEVAAYERHNEQLRLRLLELADELEAGAVRHRSETRTASLNSLRLEAIQELRAEAAIAKQEKELPGPNAGHWLHWACNLEEEKDADALNCLRTDFGALDHFAGEMEESYWMPGQRSERNPTLVSPPRPVPNIRRAPETPSYSSPAPVSPGGGEYGRSSHNVAQRPDAPPAGGTFAAAVARAYDRPPSTNQGTMDGRRAEAPSHSQRGGIALVAEPAEVQTETLPATKTCERCGTDYSGSYHVCPVSEPAPRTPAPASTTVAARAAYPVIEKPKAGGNGAGGTKEARVAAPTPIATPAPIPVERPKSEPSLKPSEKKAKSRKQRRAEAALSPVPVPEIVRMPEPEPESPPEVENESWTQKWQVLREGGAEELQDGKWRTYLMAPEALAVLALLLIVVAGSIWMVRKRHAGSGSAAVVENKTVVQTPVAPSATTTSQPAPVANAPANNSKNPSDTQSKPQDQSAAAKTNADASQPKEVTPPPTQVLSPPAEAPKPVQTAKKEEPTANEAAPQGAVPGALPGGASNMGPLVMSANVPKLAAQKLRVSSGVAQGQLLRQVTPQYPPQARQQRVEGTVVLQAVIGKDGSVQKLNIVSGPSMLTKSAMEAVKQWRYKPFALNGEPVEADTQINVNFKLGE